MGYGYGNSRDSVLETLLKERDARNNAMMNQGGGGDLFPNLLTIAAKVAQDNGNPNSEMGSIMQGAGRTYINNLQAINQGAFAQELAKIHMINFMQDPNNPGQVIPVDPATKLNMVMSKMAQYGVNPSEYKDVLQAYSKQIQAQSASQQVPLIGINSSGQQVNMGMVPKGAKMVSQNTMGMQLPQNFTPLSPTATPEERTQWIQGLEQSDPVTAEAVKGLADYTLDPSKISSYRGNQRAQFAALAKMLNPDFNMAKYGQRANFLKKMSDTSNGTFGGNVLSLNTLIGHLQLMQAQANELSNGNLTPMNAIINFAQQISGDPRITNFEQARSVVDSELERALTGIGATQGGLRAREQLLNKNASPQQMAGAIQILQDIMATRLKNLIGQYKAVMGSEPKQGEVIFPDNQAFVDSILNNPQGNQQNVMYAVNPQTKVRIKSMDGGKTWQRAQ